jgi:hypothetical protein
MLVSGVVLYDMNRPLVELAGPLLAVTGIWFICTLNRFLIGSVAGATYCHGYDMRGFS